MKHFEELLKSLGARKCTSLKESKNWTLWQAQYETPVSTVIGTYLYLKSACPLSEATAANLSDFSALSGASGYQVVVTPSSDLARDLNSTKSRFKGNAAHTTQQLLQEHLLKGVSYKPLQREEHFVSPSVTREDEVIEIDGLQFLSKWLVGSPSDSNQKPLALLTADGGIGKTTLARELCENVRVKYPRILPLLIESDQWKSLANTGFTLDTLWDIAISRRLENCGSLRSNHSALRVLMQEGLLVVIFDGFDELAALSGDSNRPQEIIAELQNLFTPEDEDVRARVILTSRTTYWTAIESTVNEANQLRIFKLNGFNNEQRKAYFEARLQNPSDRGIALRIARQISGSLYGDTAEAPGEQLNRDRLSGTPFVLSLIAHYVEGVDKQEINPYEPDPLEPLLLGVCRRENIRQNLNITPETQLAIFEEFFRLGDSSTSKNDLDFVLQLYDVSDASVRHRFSSHFFLHRISPESLGPRFEVLKVYFIARFLAKGLLKLYKATPEREIATTLSRHFLGESQVIEWLVWQLQRLSRDRLLMALKHAIQIIEIPDNLPNRYRAAIALSLVISHLIKGDSRTDRAKDFCELFGAKEKAGRYFFTGLTISGRLRSIDFSNLLFEDCTFVDVEFSTCKFAQSTVFERCVFDGTLDFSNCTDEGSSVVNDCRKSPDAEMTWSKILSVAPSDRVRIEFAEEALTRSLRKFRGDYGYHGIQYRRRNNSANPRNPYNASIWTALKHYRVVETHTISGVSEGGLNIRDDKDLRREIGQYLDNGIVGSTLQAVISELIGEKV